MSKTVPSPDSRSYPKLVSCILIAFLPSLSGWAFIPGPWYDMLAKPSWTPPGFLFGPVWTALYLLMGWALYRVACLAPSATRRWALVAFGVQLALNATWTPVFFGLREPGWGLLVILLLDISVAITIGLFWRLRRGPGIALLPYQAWILFATTLNAAIWWLNRPLG